MEDQKDLLNLDILITPAETKYSFKMLMALNQTSDIVNIGWIQAVIDGGNSMVSTKQFRLECALISRNGGADAHNRGGILAGINVFVAPKVAGRSGNLTLAELKLLVLAASGPGKKLTTLVGLKRMKQESLATTIIVHPEEGYQPTDITANAIEGGAIKVSYPEFLDIMKQQSLPQKLSMAVGMQTIKCANATRTRQPNEKSPLQNISNISGSPHNTNLDAGSTRRSLFGDKAARGRKETKKAAKRPTNHHAAPVESAAYARKARTTDAKAAAVQQPFRRSSHRAAKRAAKTNKGIAAWRADEANKIAAAKRDTEAKRIAAAERVAAAERAAEAERSAAAERAAEAKRIAAAERAAEAERIAAAERAAEAKRIAAAERTADAERAAEAKRIASAERAVKKTTEAERVTAAEKSTKAERIAAAKKVSEAAHGPPSIRPSKSKSNSSTPSKPKPTSKIETPGPPSAEKVHYPDDFTKPTLSPGSVFKKYGFKTFGFTFDSDFGHVTEVKDATESPTWDEAEQGLFSTPKKTTTGTTVMSIVQQLNLSIPPSRTTSGSLLVRKSLGGPGDMYFFRSSRNGMLCVQYINGDGLKMFEAAVPHTQIVHEYVKGNAGMENVFYWNANNKAHAAGGTTIKGAKTPSTAVGHRRFYFWFEDKEELTVALLFLFHQDVRLLKEFFQQDGRFTQKNESLPAHTIVADEDEMDPTPFGTKVDKAPEEDSDAEDYDPCWESQAF